MSLPRLGVFECLWAVPSGGLRWQDVWIPPAHEARLRRLVGRPGFVQLHDPESARPLPAPPPNTRLLLPQFAPDGEDFTRAYPPLSRTPFLFRTLAQTPLTEEGILAFAQEYGLLGLHRWVGYADVGDGHTMGELVGERLQDWRQQITLMALAVTIWDLLRSKDADGLSRYVNWQADEPTPGEARKTGRWRIDAHPDRPPPWDPSRREWLNACPQIHAEFRVVLEGNQAENLFVPAEYWLVSTINDALRKQVSPELAYDSSTARQCLRFQPENLLGALWLLFAQALEQKKEFRACRECGKWFAVSSERDGRTKRRQFCSEACKTRDYRGRQMRAVQGRAEGKTVQEIAQELKTQEATIRRWLGEETGTGKGRGKRAGSQKGKSSGKTTDG